MKKKYFFRRVTQPILAICCMLLFFNVSVLAQNSISVKGQVVDAESEEPLIGVSIQERGARTVLSPTLTETFP